jgi:PAS domain S-box-containing protein
VLWTRVTVSSLRRDPAAALFAVAIFEDVTARVHAEEATRHEYAFRKAIEESMGAGVAVIDPNGVLQYVNAAFARLVGRNANDVLGMRPPYPFWTEEQGAELHRRLQEIVETGDVPAGGIDAVSQRPDGTRRHVLIHPAPLRADGRDSDRWAAAVYDETERKNLEEQFRQAQKMEAVGRLAGGVAHDFNNLLTAILGYSEILLAETPNSDPHHDDLDQIRRAAESAAALTRQLLAFSRQQVLKPEVLSPDAVLRDLSRILQRTIGEDVRLVTTLSSGNGLVRADRSQLEAAGYTVLAAADAKEAEALAARAGDQLHLLVTDVVMPRGSGTELSMRLLQRHPRMKRLYMSGYSDESLLRHGVEQGVPFLQKPFTPDALLAAVRDALQAPIVEPGSDSR